MLIRVRSPERCRIEQYRNVIIADAFFSVERLTLRCRLEQQSGVISDEFTQARICSATDRLPNTPGRIIEVTMPADFVYAIAIHRRRR